MTKYCYYPAYEGLRIVPKYQMHSHVVPPDTYEHWIRLIVFPEYRRVYFRFPEFYEESERVRLCERAFDKLKQERIVTERYRMLFWDTDELVTPGLVRF